jgi:oligopeptide transport system permease protein
LNDPVWVQYVRWVGGLLRGGPGISYRYLDRSVNDVVIQGAAVTVHLGIMAFVLSVAVGVPLGVIGALRQNAIPDYGATFVWVIGIATPSFILAELTRPSTRGSDMASIRPECAAG